MTNSLEVSPEEYHSKLIFNKADIFDPNSYLSKSVLWSSYGISLWHWKNKIEPYQSKAMEWGSIIDMMTTTPECVGESILRKEDCPHLSDDGGYRSKLAKSWRDEHIANGHYILSDDEMSKAEEHADIILNQNKSSAAIFAESKKQVILYTKTQSGINLKGLADLIPPKDFLCDLKMCSDFTLNGFGKAIAKYGYHVQAGLYLIMWNNMNPDDQRRRFKHVWQNPSTGEVAVTEMSADDILTGQAIARHLINRLELAYKLNHFPMLTDDEIPVISRPTWAQMEDEMILEGFNAGGIE